MRVLLALAALASRDVTGYQQKLLVVKERFGYPDYLLATADDLIDAQYADRETPRPIFEAIHAAVRPTTKSRVDLGLRTDGAEPRGRLLDGSKPRAGRSTSGSC